MRLWHQSLIKHLPRQQLLGQHRECCALRGAGWGRKHSVVDYVFTHSPAKLVSYHFLVMEEMENRNYHPDPIWKNGNWRGLKIGMDNWVNENEIIINNEIIYDEHNDDYLKECLDNLKGKGIVLDI